ncbi:MAG: NAD-dependent DNA ligase LigA [Clostridiales bacterium]|nr:NAD-dependent DNA ligase LigA [Candidatus Crickella equi]
MTKEQKIARIDELINLLNEASRAYYDDASEIMTNYEYDAAYDELLALEEETGYVSEDSPSQNVGIETTSGLPKITHEKKMLSMNKTKDRDELKAWLGNHEALLSWKLDGITVVLTYEGGKLQQAVTRGNGVQGELITDNARMCKNVPQEIPFKGKCIIRGEAVIKYSDFERINEEIDDADAKYKNPRNLCSGSIRQLDPNVTKDRSVSIIPFTLVSAEGEDLHGSLEYEMNWMKEQGFEVVMYKKVNPDTLFDALDYFSEEVFKYDVPVDGMVLTLEDTVYGASLGATAKYPKNAIAFKWRDQNAETILREIEWSPSRTGLLNPVAIFDPVELEGTTVSRASVHNINIMEDLQLGIGDTVVVYKANMIIPQVSHNNTKSGNLVIPDRCPVCGGPTEIRDEDGTKTLHCLNQDCIAKHVKKFDLFVSRDALNIEGLSEAGILKLIGAGIIRDLPDLFEINQHKDEIVAMEGFGEKSFNNLVAAVNRSRRTTPERLLYGLGIPGIGVNTARYIARECRNSWDTIMRLTEEELLSIDGIGDVMTRDYTEFFANPEKRRIVHEIINELEMDETFELAGTKLDGLTFVVTGDLEFFASRKDLKTAIEMEGGKVASQVSAKTDYLITNNPDSGSSKNKMARELGVKVITENEIINMLG